MARWAIHWKWAARHLAVALVVGSVGGFGCGKSEPPRADNADSDPRAAVPSDNSDKPKVNKETPGSDEAAEDEMQQPFAKAVRTGDNPPFGCSVPATTVSGKSIFHIYRDVARQWDGIRFKTAEGKAIHYSATIFTSMGEIEMELRPDLAPNHVRSFVALARAKYYDGLCFDHVNHEEYKDIPGVRNDFLEAGSPWPDSEDGYGNVGYWLYPELKPDAKVTHVEGTVGACHGTEPDSAGCKFYIMLGKLPQADRVYTIFGQVTRGLDVANKIFGQPITAEDRGRMGWLRPENPVLIQKIVIHTSEDGAEGKK